jgi:hypothetical protein
MEKLSQNDKKKMKIDILKLNKFQWNKIKDLIEEETTKYTVKNDGIYLRLNLLSYKLQIKLKNYIDDCLFELNENKTKFSQINDINNFENNIDFINNEVSEINDTNLNLKKDNENNDNESIINDEDINNNLEENIDLDDDDEESEEESEDEPDLDDDEE